MRDQVQKALDAIRPGLQADGGDVELVNVSADGKVQIKLTGACCESQVLMLAIAAGIEKRIIKEVPEIKEVLSV